MFACFFGVSVALLTMCELVCFFLSLILSLKKCMWNGVFVLFCLDLFDVDFFLYYWRLLSDFFFCKIHFRLYLLHKMKMYMHSGGGAGAHWILHSIWFVLNLFLVLIVPHQIVFFHAANYLLRFGFYFILYFFGIFPYRFILYGFFFSKFY